MHRQLTRRRLARARPGRGHHLPGHVHQDQWEPVGVGVHAEDIGGLLFTQPAASQPSSRTPSWVRRCSRPFLRVDGRNGRHPRPRRAVERPRLARGAGSDSLEPAQQFFTWVACPASSACTSVGLAFGAPGGFPPQTLAERWNGTRWRIQAAPLLPGVGDIGNFSVACPAQSSRAPSSCATSQRLAAHRRNSATPPTADRVIAAALSTGASSG